MATSSSCRSGMPARTPSVERGGRDYGCERPSDTYAAAKARRPRPCVSMRSIELVSRRIGNHSAWSCHPPFGRACERRGVGLRNPSDLAAGDKITLLSGARFCDLPAVCIASSTSEKTQGLAFQNVCNPGVCVARIGARANGKLAGHTARHPCLRFWDTRCRPARAKRSFIRLTIQLGYWDAYTSAETCACLSRHLVERVVAWTP